MKDCFSCLYHHSFRCRNERTCPDGFAYIKWTGEKVRQCLFATTTIYQDGYIHCPVIDYMTCESCMEKMDKEGLQAHDPSQNYDVPGPPEEKEKNMPIYYTKCGREFKKSTKADTTGYLIFETENGIMDKQCAKCPFVVEVKEGWPGVHKRFECRAGSLPPNHKTTYRGTAKDKCTLQVDSLDHEFCESVIAFARNHPDLSASYNTDHLADCRRSVSVGCSQNRKGMAAKRELLEKFFPAQVAAPNPDADPDVFMEDENMEEKATHSDCYYFLKGSCCADDNPKRVHADGEVCDNFLPAHQDTYVPSVAAAVEAEQLPGQIDMFGNKLTVPPAAITETADSITPAAGFDYESLDQATADHLKGCAARIRDIKIKTVSDIGLELTLAHDNLANNKSGAFGAWCTSIGFSRDSAENYMRAYKYIAENFGNIEDAANIQPSLLFAASKPSAPAELAQAVIDGDITKHKDYIAAMKKLQEATEYAEKQAKYADEHMMRARAAEFELGKQETAIKGLHRDLDYATQQLEQAKRNGNSEKLAELGQLIKEKQDLLQEKEREISELYEQLNAPIDVAVEVREVLPETISRAWCASIKAAIDQIAQLTSDDIERIIEIVGLDNYQVLKCDFRMNAVYAAQRLEKLNADIISAPAPADAFIKKYSA